MSGKLVRILLTFVLIAGSVTYLLYTTVSTDAEYYKHVDEIADHQPDWYGKRMNLHGFVVDGSIMAKASTLEYTFGLESNGKVVQASYKGVVPDTFKSGAEVVLGGTLSANGFHADHMTAKCPSKYDPKNAPAGTLPAGGASTPAAGAASRR